MYEPAVCFTVSLLSAVYRVGLPSFLIPTTMSDPKSSNTSLLKVMIAYNNERVFIRDLNNLTLQIIHQQNTFLSGRNGCVRVDALCQSCQRHPGGILLAAGR